MVVYWFLFRVEFFSVVLVLFEKCLGLGKRFQGQEKQPNLMVVDDKYNDLGVELRWRVDENSF
jgi:hypothetical protein